MRSASVSGIFAVKELGQDSVAGLPPLCVNGFSEVAEQLRGRNQVDLVGIALQAEIDDGVLPRDQPVRSSSGRPNNVRKHL